jgi:hypothetical protein
MSKKQHFVGQLPGIIGTGIRSTASAVAFTSGPTIAITQGDGVVDGGVNEIIITSLPALFAVVASGGNNTIEISGIPS